MDRMSPIFLIGSQKSGTTSLAKQLGNNPKICLSSPKEPDYYTGNFHRGADWYSDCFDEQQKIPLDASTSYTMCPLSDLSLAILPNRDKLLDVPKRIKQDHPNAKFIYIVREPAMRIYSHYWHDVKYGREKRPFNKAIKEDCFYLELSRYHEQVSKYLEHFDKSNFLVIKFEDYVKDQLRTINQCEDFLGIPRSPTLERQQANKGQQYNSIGLFLLNSRWTKNIDKLIPNACRQLIKKAISKEIPRISEDQRNLLNKAFELDQRKLKEDFGVSYL